MVNEINKKGRIIFNNIYDQTLTYANQLTVKSWNDIINTLKTQANVNAEYLTKLHKWLIGDGEGSISLPTKTLQGQDNTYNTFIEYVLYEFANASDTFKYHIRTYHNWLNAVHTLGTDDTFDETDDTQVPTSKAATNRFLRKSGDTMSGDLDMDDHDIKNVSTIGVDGTITTATKLLVHDENDDVIPNSGSNYNASFYHASGIKFTTAQEQSKYNLYYPKETGTFVVRDDAGGIKNITNIIDPYDNNGIVFGLLNDETTFYNPDSTIGLSSTDMIGEGDIIHSLKFPDTSDGTGDGSWKTYTWDLPKQSGTIALLNDFTKDRLIEVIGNATQLASGLFSAKDKKHLDTLVALLEEDDDNVVNTINEILAIFNQYPEGAEILSVLNEKLNKSELLPIIEENAEQTSTLDIGTSATFNPESDKQIPTSKAVAGLMASAGGGSGGGKLYLHKIEISMQNRAYKYYLYLTCYISDPFDIETLKTFVSDKGPIRVIGTCSTTLTSIPENVAYIKVSSSDKFLITVNEAVYTLLEDNSIQCVKNQYNFNITSVTDDCYEL